MKSVKKRGNYGKQQNLPDSIKNILGDITKNPGASFTAVTQKCNVDN